MKRRASALALLAGACVPAAQPPAPPAAAPPPPPPATAMVPPPAADWRDIPLTPGGWSYQRQATGSTASFGVPGAAPVFTIGCVAAQRQIVLARAGAPAGTMTVTTSYAALALPGAPSPAGAAATLPAADRRLDQIAFSRGRFSVEGAGLPRLVLPAWAEPARVIEDCRD